MKIALIKLSALGDVVRTLPLAEAIKKKYPNCELTWITNPSAVELVKGNPYIDRIFKMPYEPAEEYDLLLNLDIDENATKLALKIDAKEKRGFYSEEGYPVAFNISSEYYINTIFDDELKKSNKRTYQEMIFDSAEIPYSMEKPKIYLSEKDEEYARKFISEKGINPDKLIGVHIGASPRWPSKIWSEEKLKEFIIQAMDEGYDVLAFGGPNEAEKMKVFSDEIRGRVFFNNPGNSIKEFSALVKSCKRMVCPDSFSMHISIAMGVPTIGLFFCNSPDEIEGYGLLKKVVSPMLYDFFPERMDEYNESLVNSIPPEEVLRLFHL